MLLVASTRQYLALRHYINMDTQYLLTHVAILWCVFCHGGTSSDSSPAGQQDFFGGLDLTSHVKDLGKTPFLGGNKTKTSSPFGGITEIQKNLDLKFLQRPSDGVTPMCNLRSESPPPNNSLALCCLPVGELPSGRPIAGNVVHEHLPSWINLTLARQGQKFAVKNRFSVTLASGLGLITGLANEDALNVLAFTGNSDSHKKAAKRYIATSAQMYIWFDEMFSSKDDNLVLQSISNVRAIHTRAARRANEAPKPMTPSNKYDKIKTDDVMWNAVLKDMNASPMTKYKDLPSNHTKYDSTTVAMNQFVQGMTGSAFWGYVIMDPECVFIWDVTQEELKSYLHLWAVIAYMIGVEDEYNISLQRTPHEAAVFFWEAQGLYLIPGFFHLTKTMKVMMEALAIGLDENIESIGLRRVMYLILVNLFKVKAPNLRATFTLAQELAQKNWETAWVLSTRIPAVRGQINEAFKLGFNSIRTATFGPYLTHKQIVEHVYYPNATA